MPGQPKDPLTSMLSPDDIRQFRTALLVWFDKYQRDLPWRRTRDPYAIWISEIMLQQTRVAAVIPFYERFLARFPDTHSLAEAPEADLLAHWAGLGYYFRARNLQKAAQRIGAFGSFPRTYGEVRALPGIGDYTAAAIASIAFDLPHAALDGNVLRVLSRILADPADIGSSAGRKHFSAFAQEMLSRTRPGAFNQAMMELGATVCLPRNPQCLVCPVSSICLARRSGRQQELPVKLAKTKSVIEERTLFWIEHDGQMLLWQRPADSRLMPGFWELPEKSQLPDAKPDSMLGVFRHGITFHSYRFEVKETVMPAELGACQWISTDLLKTLPLSTVLRKAQRVVGKTRSQSLNAQLAAASA